MNLLTLVFALQHDPQRATRGAGTFRGIVRYFRRSRRRFLFAGQRVFELLRNSGRGSPVSFLVSTTCPCGKCMTLYASVTNIIDDLCRLLLTRRTSIGLDGWRWASWAQPPQENSAVIGLSRSSPRRSGMWSRWSDLVDEPLHLSRNRRY